MRNAVLVGSKLDYDLMRKIDSQEAQALCDKLQMVGYFETSAKQAIGVDDAFYLVSCGAILI